MACGGASMFFGQRNMRKCEASIVGKRPDATFQLGFGSGNKVLMLTIYGNQKARFCDGLSRRNFLKIGGLAMGGLALPQILQAEAQLGIRRSHKAVIMIFLPGGPSHQDIFDLKMDAPSEIRGEFKPISTKVPGIQICEHLPLVAQVMDKMVVVRSIVGALDNHDAFQCLTGRVFNNQPPGGWPSLGAVVSKLNGPVNKFIPP